MYRLGEELLDSSPAKKDFSVLVDVRLNVNQQCALAAQKTNCILACTKRGGPQRERSNCSPLLCLCEAPQEGRFRLYVRKKFFTQRAVRRWHRLPRAPVGAPSLEVIKAKLDGPWAA